MLVMGQEAAGKFEGPFSVGPLGRHVSGRRSLQQKGRGRNSSAESAEAATQIAFQIENTEVEPCRRLDEDANGSGHTG